MLNGADATCCQTAQMLSACELHGGCIWIKKKRYFFVRKDLSSWTATGHVQEGFVFLDSHWTRSGFLDSRWTGPGFRTDPGIWILGRPLDDPDVSA